MNRVAALVTISTFLIGCSTAALLPGRVDPACEGHADPMDCQAALDAAMPDMEGFDDYAITVEPISCADGRCTTWVAAFPENDEECRPSWEAEVSRPATGAWRLEWSSHGDPPCAFE